MKSFGFHQALQRLHYKQFAVSPRAAIIHKQSENSFRLLRIRFCKVLHHIAPRAIIRKPSGPTKEQPRPEA